MEALKTPPKPDYRDILKHLDLDTKSKRLLTRQMEGMPKTERVSFLRETFPDLFRSESEEINASEN